nr:hypothetical protein FFPRI1PSEUD_24170 [Pseudomonas sp. FFPRI_1]
MLVISRKPYKSLRINDEIKIKVIKVESDSVSLQIAAPKHVTIVRSELLKKVMSTYDQNTKPTLCSLDGVAEVEHREPE